MQRVFVLYNTKQPTMPCHPARARQLLRKGRAAVYRRYPFTIILKERGDGDAQPLEAKFDPGSKTTGMALVARFEPGREVVWAGNLRHRGRTIKRALDSRRACRRSRRSRKTRYRAPRFDNRRRAEGTLPPSLRSRVDNVAVWFRKLARFSPISSIAVETVRFDTQRIQNPEISGIEYQQGELAGYELREYLLEKWNRRCAYCGKKDVPLQIDHIVPRSRGGSSRVSNLTIACQECNQGKGNRDVREFVRSRERLERIVAQAKVSLKDAAAVNATRYAIGSALKEAGLPVSFWSGGRTKYNRVSQGYPKDDWIDAACVGKSGAAVRIPCSLNPLAITATGRGSRQMCRMDRHGFPRTGAKQAKRIQGFQTGDMVRLTQPNGKYAGEYAGRLTGIRTRGNFDIGVLLNGKQHVITTSPRRFKLLQRADGYAYAL